MPRSYFQFKHFRVDFQPGVFRLGTDACFLGAYAHASGTHTPRRILDVGTGTGVIALMLAQRFPKARLTGIDLLPEAADCAAANFLSSPWSERLRAEAVRLQDVQCTTPFDWIVSNPPFFSQAFPAPDRRRHLARHDTALSAQEFLYHADRLLGTGGQCWLIIPSDRVMNWVKAAAAYGLYPQSYVYLSDRSARPAKRVVLCLGRVPIAPTRQDWRLKTCNGDYTEDTRRLWQDFYLYL